MGYIQDNLMAGEKVVHEAKQHVIIYAGPFCCSFSFLCIPYSCRTSSCGLYSYSDIGFRSRLGYIYLWWQAVCCNY